MKQRVPRPGCGDFADRDYSMGKERYVDLHLHSCHSDGLHTPAELVAMAAAKGLSAIALADHDSVDGIDEAMAAGERSCVTVIPAIELSVEYGKYHDIHLLGYFIDHRDGAFREKLALFRARRDERGRAIVDRINARLSRNGVNAIPYREVLDLAQGAVGRPHIAQALVARGLARDVQDAFDRYVVPCNVPKLYFPLTEALAEIRRIGGVSVLAHPTTITGNRAELKGLLAGLAAGGLDGIEVFNNVCFDDDMIFLESLARSHGLLMAGGSDFHGFEGDIEMGSGRGGLAVAYHLVEAMKKRLAERNNAPLSPGIP
jgi:predicted metal-dependent phosphoesterase TrpH